MENEILIRKARRGKDFTTISNETIRDPRLSMDTLGILVSIISLPEDWVIRKIDLEKRLRVGRRILDRAFNEMKAAGYLFEMEVVSSSTKFSGKGYLVYADSDISADVQNVQWGEPADVQNVQREGGITDVQNVQLQKKQANTTKETLYNTGCISDSIPINQVTDKPEEHKEGGGGPAAAKSDVEKAKDYLKESMLPYKDKYSREMLNDFFLYWTEGSQKSSKIRYQSEKFFDVGRRLATWANNNKKKFGEQTPVSKPMHNVKFNIQ